MYTIDENLECLREREKQHNEHVISIHSYKSSQRMKIVERNSEALAKLVDGMVSKRKNFQVISRVDGKSRVPLEGIRVPVVELRFPAFIFSRGRV